MAKIYYIPAKPKWIKEIMPKNVAAYCRVSTQQEIQLHSLEAQVDYYKKYITSKVNWTFVDVYAEIASGRHNKKMKEFQRMMEDCRAGKIDLILVKSISRLGRNTLQFLQACNELKSLGVEVYFEVEKTYISNPHAYKTLSVLAAVFQNESETKSFAVKWSFTTQFNDGTSGFFNRKCYGYNHNINGELEIDPIKAEVVRKIYKWHDEGLSLRKISKRLSELNIKAPRAGDVWGPETLRKILKNEKYKGDVLLQKTYVSDYFTGKQSLNRGEYPKFVCKDHHEAIIEK